MVTHLPAFESVGLRKGVNRYENLSAPVLSVSNGLFEGTFGKVQAAKMARIGIVFKTDIDGISTVINSSFQ